MAALAALACLGLVGCDSGDAGGTSDSGLPSADETTASSEPTSDGTDKPAEPPPTLPAWAANSTSPAAAKAFARHVVRLINYAGRSKNLEPLRALFGKGCDPCSYGLQSMEAVIREGSRVEGGVWSISFLRYVPKRPRNKPLIDIVIKATPERIFPPGKAKPIVNPGFESNYAWHLEYTAERGWMLVDWVKVS